jgi:3-oxoacyl-[acyl-carrier protein] reductase
MTSFDGHLNGRPVAGRRVLVTGGTRGIGRATTLAFARAGASVVTCSRRDDDAATGLAAELKEIGDAHQVVHADVTRQEDVARLIEACRLALGGLDVVVNNAGAHGQAQIDDLPGTEWHRIVALNLTASFLVTQAALPLLVPGASVVNIGASVALRGRSGTAHYTAAKAGLIGLTRSLCKELGPRGIRVNTVAPGVIETEPGAGLPPQLHAQLCAMTPLGRLGTPEDVAGAVLFLAGDASRHVSGVTLDVDGGL